MLLPTALASSWQGEFFRSLTLTRCIREHLRLTATTSASKIRMMGLELSGRNLNRNYLVPNIPEQFIVFVYDIVYILLESNSQF